MTKKVVKAPARSATKLPVKKATKRVASHPKEKLFRISVQATVRMQTELEIEAESYEEAYEMAQNLCDDGEFAYAEFRIIGVVDGPDVV